MNYRTAAVMPPKKIDTDQIWHIPTQNAIAKIYEIKDNKVYYYLAIGPEYVRFGSILWNLEEELFLYIYTRRE